MEYKLGHLPNGHSQHLLQVSQASVNGPSSLTKGPLGQTYPLTVFTPQKPEACLPQRDPSVFLQLPQRPQQGISQRRGKPSLFSLPKRENPVQDWPSAFFT